MSFRSLDRSPDSAVHPGFTYIGLVADSATNNIILEGASTSFNLYGVGGSRTIGIASWELRNHDGVIVATGGAIALATATWTPPAGLPCGWYRLYFRNASGDEQGGGCFVVTRNHVGMPTGVPLTPDHWGWLLLRGLYPGYRLQIQNVNNAAADAFAISWQMSATNNYYHAYDAARPKKHLCAYPNGTWGAPAAVSAAVATHTGIDYWESRNEPHPFPNAYWLTEAAEFYTAVHNGRADAQVVGPCPVALSGQSYSYLHEFFGGGGGNYLDGISFHTYGAHYGDLNLGRKTWDAWIAFLTSYGQHNKPRLITEAGGFMAAEYGAGHYMRQARRVMLDLMLCEQYGVPKERWWYFYAKSHGFNGFPSWLTSGVGQPFPAVAAMYTYSQELIGTTYEARHDFGAIDNDYVIGSSFRRADSTGVVVVMGSMKTSTPVTYEMTGGVATAVVAVDAWGNLGSLPVVGGLVTVNVERLPTYVHLPAGVTLTPVATTRYGASQTTGATASHSTGSYGFTDITNTVSGSFKDLRYWSHDNEDADIFSGGIWQSGQPLTSQSSQTFTLTLPEARQVSKVVIRCPAPSGYGQSTILGADIEVQASGAWSKVGEITENPVLFEWLSTQSDAVDGYYDSYWDENCVWEFDFFPTQVTAIRLVVSGVSYGGNLSHDSLLAFGNQTYAGANTVAGFGSWTPRLALQRVAVYDAPTIAPIEEPTTVDFRLLESGALRMGENGVDPLRIDGDAPPAEVTLAFRINPDDLRNALGL